TGENFRAVDVKAFQSKLVEVGILDAETAAHGDSFPLPEATIAAAARGDLQTARDVAIVFAHPAQASRDVTDTMTSAASSETRARAALILGLMGRVEAGPVLENLLADAEWDEGWNYRGMGQFGPSMSPLDSWIIAAGR